MRKIAPEKCKLHSNIGDIPNRIALNKEKVEIINSKILKGAANISRKISKSLSNTNLHNRKKRNTDSVDIKQDSNFKKTEFSQNSNLGNILFKIKKFTEKNQQKFQNFLRLNSNPFKNFNKIKTNLNPTFHYQCLFKENAQNFLKKYSLALSKYERINKHPLLEMNNDIYPLYNNQREEWNECIGKHEESVDLDKINLNFIDNKLKNNSTSKTLNIGKLAKHSSMSISTKSSFTHSLKQYKDHLLQIKPINSNNMAKHPKMRNKMIEASNFLKKLTSLKNEIIEENEKRNQQQCSSYEAQREEIIKSIQKSQKEILRNSKKEFEIYRKSISQNDFEFIRNLNKKLNAKMIQKERPKINTKSTKQYISNSQKAINMDKYLSSLFYKKSKKISLFSQN